MNIYEMGVGMNLYNLFFCLGGLLVACLALVVLEAVGVVD